MPPNRIVAGAALLLVAAMLAACNSNSPSAPPVSTHPTGHAVYSTAVDNGPWGVAISSQGLAYMTRPLTDSVAIINLSGPSVTTSFQVGNRPDDIAFNAAGTTAYVTNLNDGTVGVINVAIGAQSTTYPVAGEPLRILVGPGSSSLYVTLSNGKLVVLNASTGAAITSITIGGVPNGLALNAVASRLYVASTAGTVTVINTTTNAPVDTFLVGGTPQDVALIAGRNALYVANEAGWLDIRNLTTGARTDSIPVASAFGLGVTPDGAQVWVTQSSAGRVTIVDAATAAIVDSALTLGAPRHIAFSPLGDAALVANEAGAGQLIQ
ncbi:MAG: YncE family protein [Gemmatimonadales bacterium]